jgi:hypothetical protein
MGLGQLKDLLGIVAVILTYTIVTASYPVTWGIANGIFAVILLIRRRQLGKTAG